MDALQRDKQEYNQAPQMSVVHCGDYHHGHPSNEADWGGLIKNVNYICLPQPHLKVI